jgi:hypothetical protein
VIVNHLTVGRNTSYIRNKICVVHRTLCQTAFLKMEVSLLEIFICLITDGKILDFVPVVEFFMLCQYLG